MTDVGNIDYNILYHYNDTSISIPYEWLKWTQYLSKVLSYDSK